MFEHDHIVFLAIYGITTACEYALRTKLRAYLFGPRGPRQLVRENHWLSVHGPALFLALFSLKLMSGVPQKA